MKTNTRKLRLALTALTLIALLLGIFGAVPALAQTDRYVDPTGTDDGDCSNSTTPCQTINYAIGQAAAGDTINVAAGTYDENLSIQKPVDLIGSGATVTTITTSGSPEYLILIGNNSVPSFSQGMTISGFTLVAPSLSGDKDLIGLRASGPNAADPIVIQNNVFNGSSGAIKGIETRSGGGTHDIVVENNEFNECRYGIWLNSAIDWRIEGNTIADSQWSGLAINTSDLNQTHDIDILDNTILRTGVGTGYPEWSAGLHLGSTIYNVQVMGNIIAHGYDHGFYVMDRGTVVMTNVHINNNCIYNNTLGSHNGVTIAVDAEDNYWGCADGPGNPGCDTVSGNVDYDPWLSFCPLVPPTTVWVDDDWASQTDVDECDPSLTWQYDAFNSLQDGVDAVAEGGTVSVRDGTYGVTGQTSECEYGFPTAILIKDLDNLTIQAAPGHEPVVKPVTSVEANIVSITIQNSNHLTIDNIDSDQTIAQFDNWHVCDSDDLTVRNSRFEGGEDGIDFNTDLTTALIEKNEFIDINTGDGDEVLDFTDGSYSDVVIQDNLFENNYRHITLNEPSESVISNFTIRRNLMNGTNSEEAIRLIGASDILVENNVIMNNLQQGVYIDSGCSNITLRHNTFFNNDQEFGGNGEVRTKVSSADIVIKNNIFYANGSNPVFETSATSLPGEDYNLAYNYSGSFIFGTNTIIGLDPLFVSTTAGSEDLHLQPGSPAIEAGTDLGVTDDIEMNVRPNPAGTDPDMGAYEVPNQPPVADPNGPYSGDEGSPIGLDGTGSSDPDGDPLTYSWSVDSPLCSFDDASSSTPELTCTDNGDFMVTLVVDDGQATDSGTAHVTVDNVAPTVSIDSVSPTLVAVGEPVTVGGSFTDPGTNDTHTAVWDWGDTSTFTGTVAGLNVGPDIHTYSAAGIYTIQLTVTDDDHGAGTAEYQFVVVYDPEGGFVTGGGWIMSPEGAYTADPTLTGKANFGFVSKYKKGANVPTGNTEFQFKAGNLNFHSSSYDWLVVTGSDYARFKGEGTINGEGSYKFMLWAGDSDPDTFRIKISGDNGVIYDNGVDQEIGGGSIVIHTGKK